jgi:hypothetical protein
LKIIILTPVDSLTMYVQSDSAETKLTQVHTCGGKYAMMDLRLTVYENDLYPDARRSTVRRKIRNDGLASDYVHK